MINDDGKTDALWALRWVVRALEVLALLWMMWLFVGCSMIHTEASPPVIREIHVASREDPTFARALATTRRMPGMTVVDVDDHAHFFTAHRNKVEALRVTVDRLPEGTRLTAACSIVPGPSHALAGWLDCADDFLAAFYREDAP